MYTQFVLNTHAIHIIAFAGTAIFIEQELGHHEQGNTPDTCGCIR